ncbi:MAG: nucleoside-diphosphate kinase [Tidjanibacter sp.]|nr:nucleoside-diphosphate kinase [Tidjanibacter sp.]
MRERTFAIIKPDAVADRKVGKIIDALLSEGFDIVEMRQVVLDRPSAERFYATHAGKRFYAGLVDFMTSGPIVALQVEGEDAVAHLRNFVGTTNPRTAARGTLRRRFGTSSLRNAIHASDSPGNAALEAAQFFAPQIRK